MKNNHVNLHMNRKRALIMMLFFALALIIQNIITIVCVDSDCAQLYSLWKSKYNFSAIAQNPILCDDYYDFDAGINFSLSPDADTKLDADILMQPMNSRYTDLVSWNTDNLNTHGIAITEGIARANNLNVKDKVYSKHIVDGVIKEYIIEEILPDARSIRALTKNNRSEGIIIMGCDQQYIDNITHRSIVFTKTPIEKLSIEISETPEGIIYRSDEIVSVCKNLIPYLLLFIFTSVLITFCAVLFFYKEIKYNFRRLVMLGFSKRELDTAYNISSYGIGMTSIIATLIISEIFIQLFASSSIEIVIILIIMIASFMTLSCLAGIFKKQLWR